MSRYNCPLTPSKACLYEGINVIGVVSVQFAGVCQSYANPNVAVSGVNII